MAWCRKLTGFGLALSAALLAVAPALLPASYSVVAHTTSESAAQGVPWAWVARSGLLLFGLSAFLMAIVCPMRWPPLARWCLGAFGFLLALSAVAATRSWVEGAPYDALEDSVHSVAATAMGFAFAGGVLFTAIGEAPRNRAKMAVHGAALVASAAIPLAMLAFPLSAGLLQRAMFVVAYSWFAAELRSAPKAEYLGSPLVRPSLL